MFSVNILISYMICHLGPPTVSGILLSTLPLHSGTHSEGWNVPLLWCTQPSYHRNHSTTFSRRLLGPDFQFFTLSSLSLFLASNVICLVKYCNPGSSLFNVYCGKYLSLFLLKYATHQEEWTRDKRKLGDFFTKRT